MLSISCNFNINNYCSKSRYSDIYGHSRTFADRKRLQFGYNFDKGNIYVLRAADLAGDIIEEAGKKNKTE